LLNCPIFSLLESDKLPTAGTTLPEIKHLFQKQYVYLSSASNFHTFITRAVKALILFNALTHCVNFLTH